MSRKNLLAFKLIRKSNQTLSWRKSNKKLIPGDELQRSSEQKWIYGIPWIYMHGPKYWLYDREGAVMKDMTAACLGVSMLRKYLKGVWAVMRKPAQCLYFVAHPHRRALQKPKACLMV